MNINQTISLFVGGGVVLGRCGVVVVRSTKSLGKPLGAARTNPPTPPPPAQRSTFKEKVREQASARLQCHTCREQPLPLPQIELLSSLYSCILYYYLYPFCFIVYLTPVLIRFVKLCVCTDLYTTRAHMHIASP